jgi:hypothetical protein
MPFSFFASVSFMPFSKSNAMLSVPSKMIPPGMKAVHIGKPFLPTTIKELKLLGAKKVFVLANRSSAKFIEGDGQLMHLLQKMDLLAAPLCTSIGMGGGETVSAESHTLEFLKTRTSYEHWQLKLNYHRN